MKTIKKYEHCFGYVWNIDGKSFDPEEEEYPEKDEALIDYLTEKLKEGLKQGDISFDDFISCFQSSDYDSGNRCDTCGSYDGTTTWEI